MTHPITELATQLRGLSVNELRDKYRNAYGEETHSRNRDFLVKRVVWRLQANAEGGLSERALQRARELANDADVRIRLPKTVRHLVEKAEGGTATYSFSSSQDHRLPPPGTILTRPYKGTLIKVTVLDRGFEHDGRIFRSLSAVVREITGARWNGFNFFRLKGKEDVTHDECQPK